MPEVAFRNPADNSIVLVESCVVEILHKFRQLRPGSHEAGGILYGHYRRPHLHLMYATVPSVSDARSRTEFIRRDPIHRTSFLRARRSDPYLTYLGDWHTHPEVDPWPSSIDQFEWSRIQTSVPQRCAFLIQGRKALQCFQLQGDRDALRLERMTEAESPLHAPICPENR